MPTEAKALFRPEAVRPKLLNCPLAPGAQAARSKLANWADLLAGGKADAMKETELLPDFIGDVFGEALGYVGPAGGTANPAEGKFTSQGGKAAAPISNNKSQRVHEIFPM